MCTNPTAPVRLGILGGSFDPIHNGHLAIADAALRLRHLDRIVFVPARLQPHKSATPVAAPEHRLAMIRLAIQSHSRFSVSDRELNRPGKSYTIDTVRELRGELPRGTELFFILGSDSVRELAAWKDPAELVRLCAFIVAARPGSPLADLGAALAPLPAGAAAAIRAAAIETTASPVSSTEIRERVAAGRSIRGLVPPAVARYIAENKLYRTARPK